MKTSPILKLDFDKAYFSEILWLLAIIGEKNQHIWMYSYMTF